MKLIGEQRGVCDILAKYPEVASGASSNRLPCVRDLWVCWGQLVRVMRYIPGESYDLLPFPPTEVSFNQQTDRFVSLWRTLQYNEKLTTYIHILQVHTAPMISQGMLHKSTYGIEALHHVLKQSKKTWKRSPVQQAVVSFAMQRATETTSKRIAPRNETDNWHLKKERTHAKLARNE